MTLTLEQKKVIVKEVSLVASQAVSAVVSNYQGTNVTSLTRLRQEARKQNIYLKVIPNRLLKRAVDETSFKCLQEICVGPLMIAFSGEDPGAPGRLFKQFSKNNENFEISYFVIDSKLYSGDAIDQLASIPSRDESIAKLVSLTAAPLTQTLSVLNNVPLKFIQVLMAIQEQKQSA